MNCLFLEQIFNSSMINFTYKSCKIKQVYEESIKINTIENRTLLGFQIQVQKKHRGPKEQIEENCS